MDEQVVVVELSAAGTTSLRRSVLRDGTRSNDAVFDGDDEPSSLHLGIRLDGEIVAISSWMARPHPEHATRSGFQLRGMATHPDHRGFGFAGRLLDAGIEHCRSRRAELVWARARDTALSFYEQRDFAVTGDGYVDATTGLPHHDVIRFLD